MRRILAIIAAAVLAPAFVKAARLPDWAARAARQPTPANVGAAPAAVLHRETIVDVESDGTATQTHRIVLRILSKSGASWTTATVPYLQNASRVRTASAWLLRDSEEVRAAHQRAWIDASAETTGALYDDNRYKFVTFAPDAIVGDIFVAETQVTTPMLFAEEDYSWGIGGLPVARETYRLRVPAGFSVKAQVHANGADIERSGAKNGWHEWTLKDQDYLPAEPAAPSFPVVRPRLLARILPPPENKRFKAVVVTQWSELARWTQELNGAQCDRSPGISATAERLVTGAPNEWNKIHALARHVQGLRYATVGHGLTKGHGFRPRKASHVLEVGYGDCKDKANLLCALLREVGIEAFIAAARAYDDVPVQPDFASAAQFNHAIAAIRVDATLASPAVVETAHGRFLFFDPTDPHTALGDLPFHLQGTLVFLQKDGVNELIPLPHIPTDAGHQLTRRAVLSVDEHGTIAGGVTILGNGQMGAFLRAAAYEASNQDAIMALAREQLSDGMRNATIRNLANTDGPLGRDYELEFEIRKAGYTQKLGDSRSLLRSEIFSRSSLPALTASERRMPIKLPALAIDDSTEFTLANGWSLDEAPTHLSIESVYGTYVRTSRAEGPTIILERKLELHPQLVPADSYEPLRKFLGEVARAERASWVVQATPVSPE